MNNTVIILLGPTGVGKTGVSLILAKTLHTEIISADSMLLYRNMDIATAKPTEEELKSVPHHLINILEPHQSFSAGKFREMALTVIEELQKKNKIPLIVGGTGLYIRTLTQGLFAGPQADWNFRQELLDQEQHKGEGYLYKRLMEIDPQAAQTIHPSDQRRIVRALEIRIKADKNLTEIHLETRPAPFEFIKIGLMRDRKELYQIIDTRVDTMIKQGLIEETEKLLSMKVSDTAMQALGYKEINRFLHQECTLDEAVTMLKTRTRNYAKRQLTWFKKEPHIQWVDITGLYDSHKIFHKILNDVEIVARMI